MKYYIISILLLMAGYQGRGQEILSEERFDDYYVKPKLWNATNSRAYVDYGGLYIRNKIENINSYSKYNVYGLKSNYYVEAVFKHIEGPEDSKFGLVVGRNDEKGDFSFELIIRNNGYFLVGFPKLKDSGWRQSSAIQSGKPNTLKVEFVDYYTQKFYINDQLVYTNDSGVGQYEDDHVGFVLYDKGLVRVDDIVVKETKPSANRSISFVNLEGLIRERVKESYEKWAIRGEFEPSDQYQVRLQQKEDKINEFTEEAVAHFRNKYTEDISWWDVNVQEYDAEKEQFKVDINDKVEVFIPVPLSEARGFQFSSGRLTAKNGKFEIKDNAWTLTHVEIYNPNEEKTYVYDINKSN